MTSCLDYLCQHDLESLTTAIESLGRMCVLSGTISVITRGSELFSHLFYLHSWMKSFPSAAGLSFISTFDTFWARLNHLKLDGFKLPLLSYIYYIFSLGFTYMITALVKVSNNLLLTSDSGLVVS